MSVVKRYLLRIVGNDVYELLCRFYAYIWSTPRKFIEPLENLLVRLIGWLIHHVRSKGHCRAKKAGIKTVHDYWFWSLRTASELLRFRISFKDKSEALFGSAEKMSGWRLDKRVKIYFRLCGVTWKIRFELLSIGKFWRCCRWPRWVNGCASLKAMLICGWPWGLSGRLLAGASDNDFDRKIKLWQLLFDAWRKEVVVPKYS